MKKIDKLTNKIFVNYTNQKYEKANKYFNKLIKIISEKKWNNQELIDLNYQLAWLENVLKK